MDFPQDLKVEVVSSFMDIQQKDQTSPQYLQAKIMQYVLTNKICDKKFSKKIYYIEFWKTRESEVYFSQGSGKKFQIRFLNKYQK